MRVVPESGWERREVSRLDGVGVGVVGVVDGGLAAVVDQLVVDVELEGHVVVLAVALRDTYVFSHVNLCEVIIGKLSD